MTTTASGRCSVCGHGAIAVESAIRELTVTVCGGCGHREARHASAPRPCRDYHDHAPDGEAFLRSLQATRRRQARDILAVVLAKEAAPPRLLEFGCGRGWFLDEARRAGVKTIAGFDTSERAVGWLTARGFQAARPRADDPSWPDWSSLPFAPSVVSALDVIEHLPRAAAEKTLRRLRDELPSLEWLVVKVPVSDGVLYRTARRCWRLFPGPYRQLYQVGTSAPHYHYFSERSLRVLLGRSGFEITDSWTDHDVDNLFHRIPSLARLPGGALAARAIRMFAADSAIVVARVDRTVGNAAA